MTILIIIRICILAVVTLLLAKDMFNNITVGCCWYNIPVAITISQRLLKPKTIHYKSKRNLSDKSILLVIPVHMPWT